MNIKAMVQRLINLRKNSGISLTLLAVCPNSDAVLEAGVLAAVRNRTPMLFAATLNQVDRDGGYTGWTPAVFVSKLNAYATKYGAPRTTLFPCLDHGGPWLKDAHARAGLSFEETTAEIKRSLTAALEAGYTLLHIDPTVDPTLNGPLPLRVVVERSLDLIQYSENERTRLQLPPVAYEVGTEEVHGGLVSLPNFQQFLRELYAGLEQRNLLQAAPAFVVAQVGTDLHTTTFDTQTAAALYKIISPYQALIKGHYTDWVENPDDYPATGMGGANVGPEFTGAEYDALMALVQREQALLHTTPSLQPSGLSEALTTAVGYSNRWQKWLQPHERGLALAELSPVRRTWLLKTCARYVWTAPTVVTARHRLYQNLAPLFPDPHRYVVDRIVMSIEHYILAFNLFNAGAHWGHD
jgi:D-tagatose-1,6-bisphosphate aldolase subunit GatZ/KbaZ